MDLTLAELAAILNQPLQGKDHPIHHIVIDSRSVKLGDVFIAIKGENLDGHDFIAQAISQGAIAVVAEKLKDHAAPQHSIPYFCVSNTREALGKIATAYRQKFNIPVIGITGSCGKTSTKALIASVLAQQGKTLATEGTLNNDFGVPLTLFRLEASHQFAVIEMGANHPGEIDYLAKITQPTVAVITNSAPVHLEGFGSLAGVRQAKGELYKNLMPEGIGIMNADDEGAGYWTQCLQGKTMIRFGLEKPAEVSAENITLNDQLMPTFTLKAGSEIIIHLPLTGAHQVVNALAAAAVGLSQGLTLTQIKEGLSATPKIEKRGILQKGMNNVLVLDDSYNANPTAFGEAIKMLMAVPKVKHHIVVMGDMGELGPEALAFHAQVGRMAKAAHVTAFYSVGKLSQSASEAFGENGYHFFDQLSLIEALKEIASPESCFLIKGSKSSHMGYVVNALIP